MDTKLKITLKDQHVSIPRLKIILDRCISFITDRQNINADWLILSDQKGIMLGNAIKIRSMLDIDINDIKYIASKGSIVFKAKKRGPYVYSVKSKAGTILVYHPGSNYNKGMEFYNNLLNLINMVIVDTPFKFNINNTSYLLDTEFIVTMPKCYATVITWLCTDMSIDDYNMPVMGDSTGEYRFNFFNHNGIKDISIAYF